MKGKTTELDRRSYLKAAGAATAGMAGLSGCAGGDGGSGGTTDGDGSSDGQTAYGTLSTILTDQPNDIGDFEELIVTIDGIWLKPVEDGSDDGTETPDDEESTDDEETEAPATTEPGDETEEPEETEEPATEEPATEEPATEEPATDEPATDEPETEDEDGTETADEDEQDEEDDDSGRYYVEFEEAQQADLVQLQGGETQLIDETDVEVGEYEFLQLDVAETEGLLVDSGEQADVETPGNAPLKFNTGFEIREAERTRFVADFAPHQTGQGKYIIRPVATGTQVLYGDEEYQPAEDGETDETDDTESTEEMDGDAGSDGGDGAGGGQQPTDEPATETPTQ